jgi:hypothetical protein
MPQVRDHRTLKRAQSLSKRDVLDELKKHNINDLDDLVQARLDQINKIGKPMAKSAGLIFRAFILWSSDFTQPPTDPQKLAPRD